MANYVQQVESRLKAILGDEIDDDLAGLYALLVFVEGVNVSLVHVHDAWAVWRNKTNPGHGSLVPFNRLTPEVQELDRKYADAIRQVAEEIFS